MLSSFFPSFSFAFAFQSLLLCLESSVYVLELKPPSLFNCLENFGIKENTTMKETTLSHLLLKFKYYIFMKKILYAVSPNLHVLHVYRNSLNKILQDFFDTLYQIKMGFLSSSSLSAFSSA